MGEEFAEVLADPVPAESEGLAQQAADECPVEAIIVE
jgi:ferredoxin